MTQTGPGQTEVVLVTGPSGAGRSTAIRVLEDAGHEAIDNLPLTLMGRLLGPGMVHPRPLALGLDVRNRDFSVQAVLERVAMLRANPETHVQMLYLDCSADVLVARFSETRRRHPLAPEEDPEIGVTRELDLLSSVAEQADRIIDTTNLTVHDLKEELMRWYGSEGSLALSAQSFSYKRGLPRGLDMVFDLRFLANPHWEPALRDGTGRDDAVRAYVAADPRFAPFFDQLQALILSLLPAYQDEGRAHLTIGFGCTGGQHRSVAVTEMFADALAEHGWRVSKRHREMERRAQGKSARTEHQRPGHMANGGTAA